MKSWRTTVLGIVGAVGILCTQAGYLLDADPATTVDWSTIFAALGVFGVGFFSRDNKVSSEAAGAK